MKKGKHCEVFGNLEKLEEFSTIHNNIIPGSLVFESLNPFWGYYHDDPHDSSPVYIYFAVEKNYPAFDVVRAFQHVKAESDFNFDAAKAFVRFNDRSYNVIRIRRAMIKYRLFRKVFSKMVSNRLWHPETGEMLKLM